MRGAAVFLEMTPLSSFPAAQQQLRWGGNPSLSNLAICSVWLLQMVIHCVFLQNAMNWLGIPESLILAGILVKW
jgi:hypothetical protein